MADAVFNPANFVPLAVAPPPVDQTPVFDPNNFQPLGLPNETVLHDDTGVVYEMPSGTLARIGAIFDRGFDKGEIETKIGKLGFEMFMGNDTPTIRGEMERLHKEAGGGIKTRDWVEEGVRATAQQLPVLKDIFGKSAERAMQGGIGGGVAGFAIGGIGAVPGFFAGLGAGALSGTIEETFIIETGHLYEQIRNFKDANGVKVDPLAARIGAVFGGAASAGLEVVPMTLLFRLVPGSKNVIGKLGDKALKAFKIPTGKTALRKFVLNISTIIAAETVVEGAQEIVQTAAGEVVKATSDLDIPRISANDALDRVGNAMKEALKATPLIAMGFSAPRLVTDTVQGRARVERPDTPVERVKDLSGEVVDAITAKLRQAPVSPDLTTYNVGSLSEQQRDALEDVGIEITGEVINAEAAELIAAESMRRTDFYQKQVADQSKAADKGEAAALRKVARGRIRKIDEVVKGIDQNVDATLETIAAREAAGQPVKALNNRVNSLLKKREILDEERANLLTAETPLAKTREALKATDEIVELKGAELLQAERRTAKARQRALEKGVREGVRLSKTDVKAAQAAVIDVINQSGLDAADKAKFLTAIRDIQTGEQLQRVLPRLQNRINTLVTKARRKTVTNKLSKILKRTKVKKNKGKFGPEVQKVLDIAREAFALSKESAAVKLEERAGHSTTTIPSPIETLENILLAARSDPNTVDVGRLEELLETITALVELGKSIRKDNAMAKLEKSGNLRAEFLDLIGPERNETDAQRAGRERLAAIEVKFFLGMSGAWWNKIKRVMQSSDKARVDEIVVNLSLYNESRAFDRGKEGAVKRFTELVLAALNTTSERAVWKKLAKDETELIELGMFTHSDGVSRLLDVKTRAQLRKRVMELKDPVLRESMMSEHSNAYTDDIIQALENQMTEQDHRLVDAQLEFYSEYYTRINEVFERVYGYSLPKNEFYSPIKREYENQTVDEFMKAIQYRGGIAPGSLKNRQPSVQPIKVMGDLNTLHSHISEMEYFIAYSEKVQELNHVVGHPEVQTRIRRTFGEDMLQSINNDLDYFAKRGVQTALASEQFFATLMRNFSFAQLGAKPQIGLKQLASFAAYSQDVRAVDFTAGLVKFAANPRAALKVLARSELFLKRGNNIDQDYQALLSDKSFFNFIGRKPTLMKVLMLPIRYGDKAAIAIGAYAHYHAKVKAGVAPAQALRDAEILTVQTQQSTDIDQLSELQRTSSLMRVLTQFMSSANALTRAEYNAIVDKSAGRISKKEFAKRILILHMVIPGTIQFIANGLSWDNEDQLRASILGSLNGLFIFSDVLDGAVRLFTNGEDGQFDVEGRHPLGFVTDLFSAIQDFSENGVEWADFVEGSKALDGMLDGLGGMFGVPIKTLVGEMRGVFRTGASLADNNAEETQRGIAEMLGFSTYTIDEKILAE